MVLVMAAKEVGEDWEDWRRGGGLEGGGWRGMKGDGEGRSTRTKYQRRSTQVKHAKHACTRN